MSLLKIQYFKFYHLPCPPLRLLPENGKYGIIATVSVYLATQERFTMTPDFLHLLVCPVSKQALEYHADRQELWSKSARLAFPIRDGIPVMLVGEARELSDLEVKS